MAAIIPQQRLISQIELKHSMPGDIPNLDAWTENSYIAVLGVLHIHRIYQFKIRVSFPEPSARINILLGV
jgi:hypothetical protein